MKFPTPRGTAPKAVRPRNGGRLTRGSPGERAAGHRGEDDAGGEQKWRPCGMGEPRNRLRGSFFWFPSGFPLSQPEKKVPFFSSSFFSFASKPTRTCPLFCFSCQAGDGSFSQSHGFELDAIVFVTEQTREELKRIAVYASLTWDPWEGVHLPRPMEPVLPVLPVLPVANKRWVTNNFLHCSLSSWTVSRGWLCLPFTGPNKRVLCQARVQI